MLVVAIIVPAVIAGIIAIVTILTCCCCRPSNAHLMEQMNEKIDPLKGIDVTKIKHWTYVKNTHVYAAAAPQQVFMFQTPQNQMNMQPTMQGPYDPNMVGG